MTKAEELALEIFPQNSLEFLRTGRDFNGYRRQGFVKGYEQAEKDMMERAVETVVSLEAGGFPFIEHGVGELGLKVGDKVKLIIVKED